MSIFKKTTPNKAQSFLEEHTAKKPKLSPSKPENDSGYESDSSSVSIGDDVPNPTPIAQKKEEEESAESEDEPAPINPHLPFGGVKPFRFGNK